MKCVLLLPLAFVLAASGCGPTPNLGPRAPHGGTILPIPDGKGSLEFVKKGSEGEDGKVIFLAYFYGPDDKPLAPPPASATFTATAKGAKPIEMKPSGSSDESFTSPAIADSGEVDGLVTATVDGKPIAIPVKIR